jgi:tRNA 2-thiouridine synthesizing protein B
MNTLHTINKSPFMNNTLNSCIKVCTCNDGILLIEDGVYGALTSSPCAKALEALAEAGTKVYALTEDVKARGLTEKIAPGIQLANYNAFVQLALDHRCVQSWY